MYPTENAGKKFVQELSRLFWAYADQSALESVALQATTVMPILLLQKPAHNSRAKGLTSCLECCFNVWSRGDINSLILEGRCLQKPLPRAASSKKQDESLAQTFMNFMFKGKVSAAIDLLAQKGKGGVLHVSNPSNPDDPESPLVVEVLRLKHPPAKPATPTALVMNHQEPPQVHRVIYDRIDACCIHSAAKGSAGLSGLDAHCWRRLCTSFHSASWDLCHLLVSLAKRLCTSFVDPKGLSAFLACRLYDCIGQMPRSETHWCL